MESGRTKSQPRQARRSRASLLGQLRGQGLQANSSEGAFLPHLVATQSMAKAVAPSSFLPLSCPCRVCLDRYWLPAKETPMTFPPSHCAAGHRAELAPAWGLAGWSPETCKGLDFGGNRNPHQNTVPSQPCRLISYSSLLCLQNTNQERGLGYFFRAIPQSPVLDPRIILS